MFSIKDIYPNLSGTTVDESTQTNKIYGSRKATFSENGIINHTTKQVSYFGILIVAVLILVMFNKI